MRAGYRRVDEPTAAQLVEDLNDQLFHRVQYLSGHVLQPLLPNRRTNSHALCDRRHDFLISCRLNSLTDSNFIIRQLLKSLTDCNFTPACMIFFLCSNLRFFFFLSFLLSQLFIRVELMWYVGLP